MIKKHSRPRFNSRKLAKPSVAFSTLTVAVGLALGSFSAAGMAADEAGNPFLLDETAGFSLQSRAINGPDSDGDGIRNQDDLDDDNDGILDTDEGGVDNDGDGFPDNNSVDTDNDGAPDYLDLDSDNDGILDNMEARLSRDSVKALDQVPNGAIDIGIPVGSNGIADEIETSFDSGQMKFALPDTDQDGVPDFRDLDSDNDGIYDLIEAGGLDTDSDGRLDGFYDADGKGVDDTVQSSALPLFDTNGDKVLDFRDLDSDGDTIPDRVEAGSNPSSPLDTDGDGAGDYREADSDGDGIGDRQEVGSNVESPVDTDGDGIPDYRDTDTGDSSVVSGGTTSTVDTTGGTTGDNAGSGSVQDDDSVHPDRDADGIANQYDLDDDNDSILDSEEGIIDANGDGVADASSRDTDGDGTPDGNDLDSDNDGILDLIEGRLGAANIATLDLVGNGAIDISVSVGANGIPDVIESSSDSGSISQPLFDTDRDGTPDYVDTDSDGDGIFDLVEAGGIDNDGDGRIDDFVDEDSKGVDDSVQASALPRFDTDQDGLPDFRDVDSDADGIPDSVENTGSASMPSDSDNDGAADYREQDSDNDGVSDAIEAGPVPSSPADTNGDGIPDFQDPSVQYTDGSTPANPGSSPSADHDGDGRPNSEDSDDDGDGISDLGEGNVDSDSDGVVDRLDRDSDNDGVLDTVETGRDSDRDGVPDYRDLDSDNDGLFDALEAGRTAVTSSGRLASSASVDQFGVPAGSSENVLDTDLDGVADLLDLDSDNDGLTDMQEIGLIDKNLDARVDGFTDTNGDGVDDSLASTMLTLRDTDRDRIPDARDLDSDQDSLSDRFENSGSSSDQDNDGLVDNFVDANGDGLDDVEAANLSAPVDIDGDGLPNFIDLDSDGDGISDLTEAGGEDANMDSRIDQLTDTDGDGIPDLNDADITGGNDIDNDSIDDSVDADFVTGPDSDGDGVVDRFDPDVDGNGFAGPFEDGSDGPSQGIPVDLPDTDGDGVPDVQQGQASSGLIETGLGGSGFGCSISSVSNKAGMDPLLPLLFSGSIFMLFARLRRRKERGSNS